MKSLTTVYSGIKVTDAESDRAGQIGVYLGANSETDKHIVKFEDGKSEQFTVDQLQVL